MPISAFGVDVSHEGPWVTLRVGGTEVGQPKEYTVNSNFLTPSDGFSFTLGDEVLADEIVDLFVPGAKVELLIDGAKQLTGYLTKSETVTDRRGGTVISLEGKDAMWPLTVAQVDPDHHYPDKMPLDVLLKQLLEPYGFTRFEVDNEANVNVAANLALKQHAGKKHHRRTRRSQPKALKRYSLPKRKPQHNDTYVDFICRIIHRLGVWMWPTVDGEGIIVSRPNYDQDPIGNLIRRKDEVGNNFMHGGCVRDATEQPSFILARGAIPGRTVQHAKMRVVIGNPYTADIESIVNTPNGPVAKILQLSGTTDASPNAGLQGVQSARANFNSPNSQLANSGEAGTFNSLLENAHTEKFTWTTVIPAKPINLVNPFATNVPIPRFVKDTSSHTIEDLENFAKREMSLCTRKAFVFRATIEGHALDGVIPQVDTIIHVYDEMTRVNGKPLDGPMWCMSRTLKQSRTGGTTTDIELLPLHAIEF